MIPTKIIIPIFSILICTLLTGCITIPYVYGDYYREIERFYNNKDVMLAIEHAEYNINYTTYTNLSRWDDNWPNFIDSEVIEHYNVSYILDSESKRKSDISFYYNAWSIFYPELNFKMRNNDYLIEIKVNNEEYIDEFEIPLYLEFEIREMVIGHLENESWVYDKESWNTHYWEDDFNVELYLNFTNVYFVVMDLDYDDIYGPLAAVFVGTSQFLILDEDYDPLVIGVSPSPHIVS